MLVLQLNGSSQVYRDFGLGVDTILEKTVFFDTFFTNRLRGPQYKGYGRVSGVNTLPHQSQYCYKLSVGRALSAQDTIGSTVLVFFGYVGAV